MSVDERVIKALYRLRPDPLGRDDATARAQPLAFDDADDRRLGTRALGEVRAALIVSLVEDIGALGKEEIARLGTELMIRAAKFEVPEVVAALLGAGVDPNAPDRGGYTALARASMHGDPLSVAHLLRAGADPTLLDRGGRTALDFAASSGRPGCLEVVERLLAAEWPTEAGRRKAVLDAAAGAHSSEIRSRLWAEAGVEPRRDRTRARSVRCDARPGPTAGTEALWRMNPNDPSWIVTVVSGDLELTLAVLAERRPGWTLHRDIHKKGIWAGASEVLVFSFVDDPWILVVTKTGDAKAYELRDAWEELESLVAAGASRGLIVCAKDGEEDVITHSASGEFNRSASESIDEFLVRSGIRLPGVRIGVEEGRLGAVLAGKETFAKISGAAAIVLYPD